MLSELRRGELIELRGLLVHLYFAQQISCKKLAYFLTVFCKEVFFLVYSCVSYFSNNIINVVGYWAIFFPFLVEQSRDCFSVMQLRIKFLLCNSVETFFFLLRYATKVRLLLFKYTLWFWRDWLARMNFFLIVWYIIFL